MAEQVKSKVFAPEEIDEKRDLRNALLAGGLATLALGTMILASGPIPGLKLLEIPTLEITLVALAAAIVTIIGQAAIDYLPVRRVAWASLMVYTVIITLAIHFTGGPLTPMPALYLLVAAGASFLLGRRGAMVVALFGIFCYALVLILEYLGVLPMVAIWRLSFTPSTRGPLLVVNWLAVAIPTISVAQLTGILATRLRSTNVSLRESERLRESLTNMVVHDLRNPLTALLGGLDILRLTLGEQMSDDQKRMLENARRSGHTLLGMVGELLDLAKMEAGKLNLNVKPNDLCTLISESIDLTRSLVEIEELEIRTMLCDDVKSVPCDRQLISRVVANLMSNAIKHTPPGGTISIVARQRGNAAAVSVSDTGPGIPPEYQERIFEKFGQVEQPGKERRGTGLGLTFCRMAVEAHGGRIWVESEVGHGSTFHFTLPMPIAAPAAEGAKSPEAPKP
jgi:signal transduction histidine kinase